MNNRIVWLLSFAMMASVQAQESTVVVASSAERIVIDCADDSLRHYSLGARQALGRNDYGSFFRHISNTATCEAHGFRLQDSGSR
jgi:hypothetical protein